MGIISAKAAVAGVVATGVIAGGVMFTGGETVDNVKTQLNDLKNKVVQYEVSEGSLLDKINFLKTEAAEKIELANENILGAKNKIKDLEADKKYLEKQTDNLNNEIEVLTDEKEQLIVDLEAANSTIAEKDALIEEKQTELESLKKQLSEVNGELDKTKDELTALQDEYDALKVENNQNKNEIARLEAEVNKANDKVEELGNVSQEVAAATEEAEPMTEEEINNVDIEIGDIHDAELVIQKLNLTYIQDGQSDKFKAEHPDLDIQEGDRVWRVTNNNDFKVYVEWQMAGGRTSGELVANPTQTFYMTGQGGTMIIKWQDENGKWQQKTKAGA